MGSRRYIKNLCSDGEDAYHCNYTHWNRKGAECPCKSPLLNEVEDGVTFEINNNNELKIIDINKEGNDHGTEKTNT